MICVQRDLRDILAQVNKEYLLLTTKENKYFRAAVKIGDIWLVKRQNYKIQKAVHLMKTWFQHTIAIDKEINYNLILNGNLRIICDESTMQFVLEAAHAAISTEYHVRCVFRYSTSLLTLRFARLWTSTS